MKQLLNQLKKLIDENVECVDTPNGEYLNREQVFQCIDKIGETDIFPPVKEGQMIWGSPEDFQQTDIPDINDILED